MPNPPQSDPIRFGPFELNPASGELLKDGAPLSLQPQPFRLLHLLLSRSGELVTREELRQTLWPDGTTVDFDQGLNYSIRQIRSALGESASTPTYIETLPKRGYRFIAPLQTTAPPIPPRPTRRLTLLAAALAILGVVLVYTFTTGNTPSPKVILVRPFVPLGLTADQAWFPDALAQHLVGQLARTRKVRVLPWSTSLALKSSTPSLQSIHQQFGAEAVLEGSVRIAGQSLTVVAQLVDTRSASTLWSHTDHRDSIDLAAVENNLLAAITRQLQFRAGSRPLDLDTHNLFLRASSMKDQLSANGAEQSAKAFEEVIRRAPTYAPAYAGLANTMATFPFLRKVSPQETLQKAAETARHAIQLDPSLAEAHSALAHAQFNLWNWREAESEFRIALNLDPDSATTLQLFAISLATEARFEEALSRAEAAAKLAPTSGLMTYTIALIHFHAGHFDQAIEAGKRTLDIDRGFAQSHHIISRAYAMKGMLPKALEEQAEWLNHGAGRNGNLWSAHLQALNGNKSAALQILKQWDEGNSNNASPPLAYPVTLLACGQIDRGLAALRQLVQGHVTAAIWLRATPELNRWKNDPRYVSAVALLDNPPKAAVASVPAAIALSTR